MVEVMDTREAVAAVKSRLNIVDFFKQKGFDLQYSGTRCFALCPFHDEKTPSFSISETNNSYYCFGCHKHGDLFTYLEEKEGLSFREALEQECEQLGIQIKQDAAEAKKASKRRVLLDMTNETWEFFRRQYDQLPDSHRVKAHEIREKRGISSDAKDNHYLFGWAPENGRLLVDHLRSKGYHDDDMIASGIIRRSQQGDLYCLWRARLMFPICDVVGRPLGFAGRAVFYEDGQKIERKYVNSPESEIYHKRDLLFCQSIAREQARKDHEVYVVEGQFDVIAMQHAGHDNTVASSGTALSRQQAQALQRMVGPQGKIIFMFDADAAGQKAARRTFEELGPIQPQAWASITDGKDPSDMLKDDGPAALDAKARSCIELWKHVINMLSSQYDMSDSGQAREFAVEFCKVYSSIQDTGVADDALRLASLKSGLLYRALKTQADKERNATSGVTEAVPPVVDTVVDIDEENLSTDPAAQALNATALENPSLRPILKNVKMDGMDDRFRKWMLKQGDRPLMLEDLRAINGRQYMKTLQSIADKMHEFDLVSPVPMDPAELMAQQVEVLSKSRREQAVRKILVAATEAGATTDKSVLEEYDSHVRTALTEVDEENDERVKNARETLSTIAPGVAYRISSSSADGTPSVENTYVAQFANAGKTRADRLALETIDPDEPCMAWPNGPVGDDDAPLYDQSQVADDRVTEINEILGQLDDQVDADAR